jgi:hypothetical protein
MASLLSMGIQLLVSTVVSAIIIYVATKLLGEKEGIGRAFLAAIIGAVIYGMAYFGFGYLLPQGSLIASAVAGVFWLFALKGLYEIGWARAFVIAIIVWVLATLVGLFLPTLTGPL